MSFYITTTGKVIDLFLGTIQLDNGTYTSTLVDCYQGKGGNASSDTVVTVAGLVFVFIVVCYVS